MYNNSKSPIMVISKKAAEKMSDAPKRTNVNKAEIIKKAKDNLKKAGLNI